MKTLIKVIIAVFLIVVFLSSILTAGFYIKNINKPNDHPNLSEIEFVDISQNTEIHSKLMKSNCNNHDIIELSDGSFFFVFDNSSVIDFSISSDIRNWTSPKAVFPSNPHRDINAMISPKLIPTTNDNIVLSYGIQKESKDVEYYITHSENQNNFSEPIKTNIRLTQKNIIFGMNEGLCYIDGSAGAGSVVYSSLDGLFWKKEFSLDFQILDVIQMSNGKYLAVNGEGDIISSNDLKHWEKEGWIARGSSVTILENDRNDFLIFTIIKRNDSFDFCVYYSTNPSVWSNPMIIASANRPIADISFIEYTPGQYSLIYSDNYLYFQEKDFQINYQ